MKTTQQALSKKSTKNSNLPYPKRFVNNLMKIIEISKIPDILVLKSNLDPILFTMKFKDEIHF